MAAAAARSRPPETRRALGLWCAAARRPGPLAVRLPKAVGDFFGLVLPRRPANDEDDVSQLSQRVIPLRTVR